MKRSCILQIVGIALTATLQPNVVAAGQQRIADRGVPSQPAIAQLRLKPGSACSWNEDAIVPDTVFRFPADRETESYVDAIMKYTGLDKNFELGAADVPNALAGLGQDGKTRLILYSQAFMRRMVSDTQTNWSAVSILAHEIGHHLNFHTFDTGGEKALQELAADRYSGDILYKMGATLAQARAAMEIHMPTKALNYPPKDARIAAITSGYIAARDLQEKARLSPGPAQNVKVPTARTAGPYNSQDAKVLPSGALFRIPAITGVSSGASRLEFSMNLTFVADCSCGEEFPVFVVELLGNNRAIARTEFVGVPSNKKIAKPALTMHWEEVVAANVEANGRLDLAVRVTSKAKNAEVARVNDVKFVVNSSEVIPGT